MTFTVSESGLHSARCPLPKRRTRPALAMLCLCDSFQLLPPFSALKLCTKIMILLTAPVPEPRERERERVDYLRRYYLFQKRKVASWETAFQRSVHPTRDHPCLLGYEHVCRVPVRSVSLKSRYTAGADCELLLQGLLQPSDTGPMVVRLAWV